MVAKHGLRYAHEIKQLRTVQQRHLRSILKIRWNNFVSNLSNESVLDRSNVDDVEVLGWLGHVCRMGNERT